MRSEPRKQAAFRVESSSYTLDGVAPGRKPHYGDQTTCSPSTGHGPRHSAWEGFRTMYLYQELSLGGGRIALGLPRLLITRPPSRPKRLSEKAAAEIAKDRAAAERRTRARSAIERLLVGTHLRPPATLWEEYLVERLDERPVDGLHYHAVVRSVDENLQARMPVKIDVHVPDGTIFVQTASLADALEWISTDPFVP